jgi:[ribosomal protein S18]-alanine N-acetyltransferase
MTIRPILASDVDAVLRINMATAPLAVLWTRSMYEDTLEEAALGKVWVAEEQGAVVGFICFRVVLKEIQVLNLAVDPCWHTKRIGSRLLESVWREAIRGGAEEMTLEVRKSNTTALEFYKRHGFEPERERAGFYSQPAEGAICLVRRGLQTSGGGP